MTDNISNNNTMVAALGKVLKDIGLKFNKQYHMSGTSHILNVAVQQGLREISAQTIPLDDEETKEHVDPSQNNN